MSRNFLTTRSMARRTLCVGVIATTALFGLAACGGDDDSSSTTTTSTTEATTTTAKGSDTAAETAKFDKSIQQELADVGCHPGAVDGKLGPNTDAAILRFQEASGLTPDGELGPETEEALKKAVAEGKKVCTDTTTTTAKAPTTTIPANGQAPCTAAALLKGLPAEGETIANYICIGGYAAGSLTDGTKFLLQSDKGQWYAPSQDPCGSASAGIDPKILEDGCPT